MRVGEISIAGLSQAFLWPAGSMLAGAALFLLYVKIGKFRHRDFMLSLHPWRGDEQVLDVGCGRGLLLAGAARRLESLHGTGHVTASIYGPALTWVVTRRRRRCAIWSSKV